MKNKIQKFSKGDFQLSQPDVIFDETNLVLIIGEGKYIGGVLQSGRKAERRYGDWRTRLLFVCILRIRGLTEILRR